MAGPQSPHHRSGGHLRPLRDAVAARLPSTVAELVAPSRLAQALVGGRLTTTPIVFTIREALSPAAGRRRGQPREYRLRASGLRFSFRHGTVDIGVLSEIFALNLYAMPVAVRERLDLDEQPSVLDLGAHIGLFGLWAFTEIPATRIVAFEPDAANYAVLEACVAANGLEASWELRQAAAAGSTGRLSFEGGLSSGSHVTADVARDRRTVAAEDVIPRFANATLLKMDMEGSEWPIIGDARFAGAAPDVVVLEYHPNLCPGGSPRELAERTFRDLGYTVSEIFHDDVTDVGMLWAVRAASAAGEVKHGLATFDPSV